MYANIEKKVIDELSNLFNLCSDFDVFLVIYLYITQNSSTCWMDMISKCDK